MSAINAQSFAALPKSKLTNKPVLHFAHANGIPSPVYTPLLADLQRDHDVVTLPEIGTDPRYPVTNHWPHLVEELIEAPVTLLSTSPDRDDTILMHDPFLG